MSQFKMRYDHEDDVLMIWFAEDTPFYHAEQVGSAILHMGEQGEPILLEVLNARDFVTGLVRTAMTLEPAEAVGD